MSQSISAPTARNGSIDLARWIGCIGIVMFHLGSPGAKIGYAGLPMFMMLVVYFGASRPVPERLKRLLTPFVIWSAIYGAFKLAEVVARGKPLLDEFHSWMLLTGPALHLWFLPFAAAFLALGAVLRKPAAMLGLGLPVSALAIWAANAQDLPIPFVQWCQVFPAAFLGLIMARMPRPDLWCLGMAAVCAGLWFAGLQQVVPQTALASGVVFLALRLPIPSGPLTRQLAGLGLGVYLVHPLVGAFGLQAGLSGLVFLAVVLVVSHIITLILRRYAPILVG